MNLALVRSTALDALYGSLGIPMSVTPVNGSLANVTGIWRTPTPTDLPTTDLRRRDRHRAISFRRSEVPTLTLGALVTAQEIGADAATNWKVDGFERVTAEQWFATVVPTT